MRRSRHWDDRTPVLTLKIEPAAVLWRVMLFEPLDQPPGFGGREGLVERSFAVDVKVVLDQNNDLGGGEVSIGEVLLKALGRSKQESAVRGNPHAALCVQRRLACSAGMSPAGVIVWSPIVWIAEERETELSKPIDKASLGEVTSYRAVTKVNALWQKSLSSEQGTRCRSEPFC